MIINVQEIRKGMVFKYEGDLWSVMTMQHVTPGKGGAFVKIRARSQKNGNAKEMNFRSGEKIDTVDIFERRVTYSYKDGSDFVFMDAETFEEYHLDASLCEDVVNFVLLSSELSLNILDGKVMSINIPNFVTLKVVQANPGIKGDTATKATKIVELETGYKLTVPLFVNQGDHLKIDTRTGEYLERIKA